MDLWVMPVVVMVALGVLGLLVAGMVLVIRDTVRGEGRWGINTRPIFCPRCDEPAPTVRVPANWRQTLWGGNTCQRCGCEYDKWGKPVDLGKGADREPFHKRPFPDSPAGGEDAFREGNEGYREKGRG